MEVQIKLFFAPERTSDDFQVWQRGVLDLNLMTSGFAMVDVLLVTLMMSIFGLLAAPHPDDVCVLLQTLMSFGTVMGLHRNPGDICGCRSDSAVP